MKKITLLFISIAFTLYSCSENKNTNECFRLVQTGIDGVALIPTADMIGAVYKVDFPISNGCGKFDKFEETSNGNTRIIKVFTKYQGCICNEIFSIQSANYTFTNTNPGTYTLKFLKADGSFFTETVVIN